MAIGVGTNVSAQPITSIATPMRPSSVVDQAAKLRAMSQVAQARTHVSLQRASVLAITSGKGGVGKSNVAVNLSIRLAQSGRRVILLDADLGLANADVLCNVEIKANLAHVVARQRELAQVLVEAPGGFKLIGGASGLARMADLTDHDRQRLVLALEELEAQADHIIIDTGAGISPNVLCFTRAADQILVVTTPEPTAITDAYAVIKVLQRTRNQMPAGQRISLLVNMARSAHEAAAVYQRIAQVARQFLGATVYDAGHVLADPAVSSAVRSRVPFVVGQPRCEAARCVGLLAGRLGQTSILPDQNDRGFFDRMNRWIRGSA